MGDGRLSIIMRRQVFSFLSSRERSRRWLAGLVAGLFFAMVPAVWGQTGDQLPLSNRVLTNINQMWTVPQEHAGEEFRIRTEVVIYYFDAEWGNALGECMGIPQWLPIDKSPTPLKAGQRVAIDGVLIPGRQQLVWDKTRIRILEENVQLKAETVRDVGKNSHELSSYLVSVEGLIDHRTA
jgi:hypothetical protein